MNNRRLKLEAPSFQFVKLAEEFIASVRALLKDNAKIKGLRPLQAAVDSLASTLQSPDGKLGIKPALEKTEGARKIGTPESLDEEYNAALKEKEIADGEYRDLPRQHEENLNKQKRLRNAKIEDISLKDLQELNAIAKESQQIIIKYVNFDAKLNQKRTEQKKLSAKIQAHCCGGPLCNEEDLARLRNLDHEITVLEALQNTVSENPVRAQLTDEEVLSEQGKLEKIRQNIEDLIDGYKDRRKAAQKKVDDAADAISRIYTKIDNYRLEQSRAIDRNTMFDLVHLRARLTSLYRLVDKIYHEDSSTKAVLDSLTSARESWRDKFNNALSGIHYPDAEGKTALVFYADYTKWALAHAEEQQKIESAVYSPNEYIKFVVPEATQAKTEITHTSSFGTVHDFFPTAARAKKKKSTDAPSVKSTLTSPGINVSASSTTS